MSDIPSLAPLIVESERVLAEAIKYFGLQVKPSQIVFTIQNSGRMRAYGWFSARRWQNGRPEALHEINLSAEHLKKCDVGEVLLHELAHAENKQLEIQDCAGQRHNRRFKRMAERLGLEVEPPDDAVGYGITNLGVVASSFLEHIAFKRELFSLCRLGGLPQREAPGSRLVKWECPDCGYTMRLTNKWLSKREPACPLCSDRRSAGGLASSDGDAAAAKFVLTDDEIAGAADVQLIKIEKANGKWRLKVNGADGRTLSEDSYPDLPGSVEGLWQWMKAANLLEAKAS